jgi:hypothetical protein
MAVLLAGGRADAAAEFVLAGRVDDVVATPTVIAALRGGRVLLLDHAGQLVGRCAELEAPDEGARAAAARPRRAPADAEEVLRQAGLSDDDTEDEDADVEEALDDEGLGRARRRPPAGVPPAPGGVIAQRLAVAAGRDTIWIATSAGLWRVAPGGAACAPAGLGGRDLGLVAAAGEVVVAISDATVWRSRDGGASFAVLIVLPARARALALVAGGAVAVIGTDDGVLEIDGAGAARRVLDLAASALAACGDDLVALAGDGAAYGWKAGAPPIRLGDAPPARLIACDATAAGPSWIAAGAGLWTSADGGDWVETGEAIGRGISAVAPGAGGAAWLAGDDGLLLVSPVGGGAAADPERGDGARARPRPPAAWAALLPHVTLLLAFDRSSTRGERFTAWVLLTFPLGRARRAEVVW